MDNYTDGCLMGALVAMAVMLVVVSCGRWVDSRVITAYCRGAGYADGSWSPSRGDECIDDLGEPVPYEDVVELVESK